MATTIGKPTQEFVPISAVRDGYAILHDGSMRAILIASSLNFALKSQNEQQAILMQFQNLLNSLDFSIQIFVESRKLDIRPYIALLEQRQKEQMNDLMKIQIEEYISFVKNFTETTNIMSKSFFVVIPYSPAVLQRKNAFKIFSRHEEAASAQKKEDEIFEENRAQLEERISVVEQGLTRCGIRVAQLGTEEITELFYKLFNPGESEKPIKLS
jgi:hypothetical protein